MLAAVQVEAEDRVCRRIAAGAHHTVAVMAGACALSALSDV